MKREIPMPNADGPLDLPTARREFRGLRFANDSGDARGAASAGFVRLDLDPAKRGGLFHLPFPHAVRPGEFTHGHGTGVPY